MDAPIHVVATAGHVDHGKSSLIVRLTGIDPDRWAEEKRRGLTIDLGFAWATLPSGREIGFVDVPGHERFVRNMLAGVGPVGLVLFVVAADEGWKPQSEEHLAIIDVLEAHGGVVALTKADLVDPGGLAARESEVRDRIRGSVLEGAPLVACSSTTGAGVDALLAALDHLVAEAPPPADLGRPRIHIDRSFSIRGAGTVVTGTLTDGSLSSGDEVTIYPSGTSARIRSLQTHRRQVEVAHPVARVAANLAGTGRDAAERGDVLGLPGQWRPTSVLEITLSLVRGASPIRSRGAYKVHIGSAERDARLRLLGHEELAPGEAAFARITLSRPVTVAVGDRLVLRDTGSRATVAGGAVLDTQPPPRPGREAEERLARRRSASPAELPAVMIGEHGAVRAADLAPLIGRAPATIEGAVRVGAWWLEADLLDALREAVTGALAAHHRDHPLDPGVDAIRAEAVLLEAGPGLRRPLASGLGGAVIDHLERDGALRRDGTIVRLPEHQVSLGSREDEATSLIARIRSAEPTPPGVKELLGEGHAREVVEAAVTTGRLVKVADDLVVTPDLLAHATEVARTEAAKPEGVTVSRFRELLGTTRKYALPLLEHLDRAGVTRRDGDVRRPGPASA